MTGMRVSIFHAPADAATDIPGRAYCGNEAGLPTGTDPGLHGDTGCWRDGTDRTRRIATGHRARPMSLTSLPQTSESQ